MVDPIKKVNPKPKIKPKIVPIKAINIPKNKKTL